jgi:hypothetical protein
MKINLLNMRKIYLLVFVCTLFLFASCKKKYTCTCTTYEAATGNVISTSSSTIKSKDPDEAWLTCDDGDNVNVLSGIIVDCDIP